MAIYLGFMHLVLHNGCPFVVFTGFPCPACGLTRAGIHLLKGEFLLAWNMNLMIYPLAVIAATAFVYRYMLGKSVKFLGKYLILTIVLMIVYYLYRMFTQFPGNPPMSYYYNNFLGNIVKWLKI